MNQKMTHIEVVGEGKNITLVPFYQYKPVVDPSDESKSLISSRPSGLSLDLQSGMALFAFRNFLPACALNPENRSMLN